MTAMLIEETWDGRIVLQNGSGEILSANYPLKKAARLLALEKAVIVEAIEGTAFGAWLMPKILRLKEYIYIPWEKLNGPPRVSKRGVLVRDKHLCAYCNEHATTIDHVLPRSRGGKNTWQNLVAACQKCNHRKGNRTPEEAKMTLLWKGYMPKRSQLR